MCALLSYAKNNLFQILYHVLFLFVEQLGGSSYFDEIKFNAQFSVPNFTFI